MINENIPNEFRVAIQSKRPNKLATYSEGTYFVNTLKTVLENEENTFGLEIVRTIRHTLKTYLVENGSESLNTAIYYLLTKPKDQFLYKSDVDVKIHFDGVPFDILVKLAELSSHLNEEISSVYKKNKIHHGHREPDSQYNSAELEVHVEQHFYKPIAAFDEEEDEEEEIITRINWLRQIYSKYKNYMPGFLWEDFENLIEQLFSVKNDDREIIEGLFDMLGFQLRDLVVDILAYRESMSKQPKAIRLKSSPEKKVKQSRKMPQQLINLNELITKIVSNARNPLEPKKKSQLQNGGDKELITRQAPKINTNPNIHDQQLEIYTKKLICGKQTKIPFDAVVRNKELYDEITIPPQKCDESVKDITKISVDSLDAIGKLVFKDIKTFNHIQSEVFNIAYNTNENMLVCAPTGCGKTNIALMTIVNQIKKYIEDDILRLEKFKIVYICPMKALAAEITANFSKKLSGLGVVVKELTGDMQLTRREMLETQMFISTPEKWDVVSRKGTADAELTSLVKLLIVDEVHLINTDRGPVIEALIARTLRQVISSQNMIRIVGLSATLPSYMDVGHFLRVNPEIGLFYFDNRYRSVPLIQTFIGIKTTKVADAKSHLDEACFEKVIDFLKDGHQVLVFVHARNQTVQTANFLKESASKRKLLKLFEPPNKMQAKKMELKHEQSFSNVSKDLQAYGLGIHHAGMMRHDRSTTEKQFLNGSIRVLVCTATLAWGVNLPAHGVIIKGTEMYNSKKGCFVDLDILDVLQIFGRAGRPQFDTSGHGIIITSNEKVNFYLSMLTNQLPIESSLMAVLPENLNAEIVLGTISNIQEAVLWLTFTYMYRRMRVNPHVYGLLPKDIQEDPTLRGHLLDLCHKAAVCLDKAHMVRYDVASGELSSTYIGRTASYFYITVKTIEYFNERKDDYLMESDIIYMMCSSSEFQDIQVRPDEVDDIDHLLKQYCQYPIPADGVDNVWKTYVLMQTYLSRGYIKLMSLASDMVYINQNSARIARALFDIAIHQNKACFANHCLTIAQAFEHQMWPFQSELRQFPNIPLSVIEYIEEKSISIQDLKEMDPQDLGYFVRNHQVKHYLSRCINSFPLLNVESSLHPVTRGVLRIKLFITPSFIWNDTFHGKYQEYFWLWIEDPDTDVIYHFETLAITKSVCLKQEMLELVVTIPYSSSSSQYIVRISSDRWMHAVNNHALSFRDLQLPSSFTSHTELLELRPLSVQALKNPLFEGLYNFPYFNPIQTQIFHSLYHTDNNILLGAPTGSGKTIVAEICIFKLFRETPHLKVIYIAPLKALVRERVDDWKQRFGGFLGKTVIEITGDVTPNIQTLTSADIIITTPEKWDGLTRGWQSRKYIQQVGLIIIDEIHLLGEDRGPVLEVIVSRINFIMNQTKLKPRLLGLSTTMANAGNLANWLGIGATGLYNFRPVVRPVPLDVHIMGFPGKNYCPRMISMNRPAYQAIRLHAPDSPTLIFCSSRKQTRLTAIDLITFLLTDVDSKRWLHCDEEVMENIIHSVSDSELKHFLAFGVGIHHAGLQENDRKIIEELFVNQKIQVLISTATLAWGVNFPAHLVIIKGTEYFDGKTKRYIDMPITDVLQMMGRAGRPQFDSHGVACVFVQDVKKNFYKKFLYEPFPIESNLIQVLPDHINAEISSGSIATKDDLMKYITWTFLYQRINENPSYYNLHSAEPADIQKFFSDLLDSAINTLVDSQCITAETVDDIVHYETTFYGQIASFYYLSYKTMVHFRQKITENSSINELIQIMCATEEYATFPVRHNEDKINKDIAKQMNVNLRGEPYESPHTKVFLLIKAYLLNFELPNQEYVVDLKSVMDQALRILQGMIDVTSRKGWLSCSLKIVHILQMLVQGQQLHAPILLTLPHVNTACLNKLEWKLKSILRINHDLSLLSLRSASIHNRSLLEGAVSSIFDMQHTQQIVDHISNIPLMQISLKIPESQQEFSMNKIEPVRLQAGRNYEFLFQLKRFGPSNLTVNAPRFSKKKDEGWFICIGDTNYDRLMQIERVTCLKQTCCMLNVTTPNSGNYILTVFLLSDSYLGLDQQYDIPVIVYD